jgi:8-oxo-dGTP diphosphatase
VHPGKRVEALRWQDVDVAAADETLALAFTLGELQQYCENMLGRKLDKSSFRRRLDDRGCVEAIPDEFRVGVNRPAQVYRAAKQNA